MVALLFFALKQGEKRYVFKVHRFLRPLPVPIAHTVYSGTATWVGKDEVKTHFSPFGVEEKNELNLFQCVGYLKTPNMVCYLLEYRKVNGQTESVHWVVEKAEFIEPYIEAIRRSIHQFESQGAIPDQVNPKLRYAIPWYEPGLLEQLDEWDHSVRTVKLSDFVPWE